jgi:ribosome-binding protein aMBF1 (putative translation factor)
MMSDDPTRRPIDAEKYVSVGTVLKQKRTTVGWSRRYAAARLTLPESDLASFENGHPIRYGQFQRLMRVYNRTIWKLTHGMARSTSPGRFQ